MRNAARMSSKKKAYLFHLKKDYSIQTQGGTSKAAMDESSHHLFFFFSFFPSTYSCAGLKIISAMHDERENYSVFSAAACGAC